MTSPRIGDRVWVPGKLWREPELGTITAIPTDDPTLAYVNDRWVRVKDLVPYDVQDMDNVV